MFSGEMKIVREQPRAELFYLWRSLHEASAVKAKVNHPDRHISREFYDNFLIALEGLKSGEIGIFELKELIDLFIKHNKELDQLVWIASLWYGLGEEHHEVDREFALYVWKLGLDQIAEPFLKAEETVEFVTRTNAPDGQERLLLVAEEVRQALPAYEMIPRIYPVMSSRDDIRLGADIFTKVSNLVTYCQSVSVEVEDLDDYLLGAIRTVDLGRCSGWVTYYLLKHLERSRRDKDEKEKLIAGVLGKVAVLPRGEHNYDRALLGVIAGYLALDEFEKALVLWRTISDEIGREGELEEQQDWCLEDIWEICKGEEFGEKTKPLMAMLEKRLEIQIAKFNRGQLADFEMAGLLKLLIDMAS